MLMFYDIAIVYMIPQCNSAYSVSPSTTLVNPWLALGPLDLNLFALGFEEGEGVAGASTKKFMTQECVSIN